MRRSVVLAFGIGALLVPVLVTGQGSAAVRLPTILIQSVTVDRRAHTIDLRVRICFSSGPRALIAVSEQRSVGGRVVARRHWVPRGVEPTRISPYSCRANWRLNWLLEPGLRGTGTYTASIRVRDAYGRWTPPIAFSVTSA